MGGGAQGVTWHMDKIVLLSSFLSSGLQYEEPGQDTVGSGVEMSVSSSNRAEEKTPSPVYISTLG